MDFKKTCQKIKNLKIQGASNVALAAVKALAQLANNSKSSNVKSFFKELEKAQQKLVGLRQTEPMLRNLLKYYIKKLRADNLTLKELKTRSKKVYMEILQINEQANNDLIKFGSNLAKNYNKIYTHCHSSTVVNIIKKSALRNKKLVVYNTETRPLYQGRLTAKELSLAKIKVNHYIDSAMKHALKAADIVLIGADAITPTSVYNKIGSSLVADIANKYDVPVYVCSLSWKFDPVTLFGYEEVIESRPATEVWKKSPKNVHVFNYAFERIDSELITGIISELGVYKPDTFVQVVKKANPWMF